MSSVNAIDPAIIVDPKLDDYHVALKKLHRKEGECLKCGTWITTQNLHGSLCHKCNEDFAQFEEQEDIKYMSKNPDKTILDPDLFERIFKQFIGLGVVNFVLS